jgi:hypothetical protein
VVDDDQLRVVRGQDFEFRVVHGVLLVVVGRASRGG